MDMPDPLVYLVDDDPGVLTAMARLLRAEGLQVAPFASAESFLRVHDPDMPGCAVVDVRMPGLDGLALQEALGRGGDTRALVFVTGYHDVEQGVRAMKAGAVDFLMKPLDPAEFVDAVLRALVHDAHERAVRCELQRLRGHLASLTRREQQVLQHVVSGRLNKQIASDLGIAEKTIKVHRARVMEKMGASSLAQLVREALALEAHADGEHHYVIDGRSRVNGHSRLP
jgi:two-component system response regulator FixJ